MPSFVFIPFAYSHRDGGWMRLAARFFNEAGAWECHYHYMFALQYELNGDYTDFDVIRTVAFPEATGTPLQKAFISCMSPWCCYRARLFQCHYHHATVTPVKLLSGCTATEHAVVNDDC